MNTKTRFICNLVMYVKLLMKLWSKNETPNQLSKSSQEMNLRNKRICFICLSIFASNQFSLTAISILAVQGICSFVAVIVIFFQINLQVRAFKHWFLSESWEYLHRVFIEYFQLSSGICSRSFNKIVYSCFRPRMSKVGY